MYIQQLNEVWYQFGALLSLAINVLTLLLLFVTVLWRPIFCAHFTDEETLIQTGWVAYLVSDRTRGLNPDLSDIRAKLLHSGLGCLPTPGKSHNMP